MAKPLGKSFGKIHKINNSIYSVVKPSVHREHLHVFQETGMRMFIAVLFLEAGNSPVSMESESVYIYSSVLQCQTYL